MDIQTKVAMKTVLELQEGARKSNRKMTSIKKRKEDVWVGGDEKKHRKEGTEQTEWRV